jgi:hypothetical protein
MRGARRGRVRRDGGGDRDRAGTGRMEEDKEERGDKDVKEE